MQEEHVEEEAVEPQAKPKSNLSPLDQKNKPQYPGVYKDLMSVRWVTYWHDSLRAIPDLPGVYVVYDDGTVAYVGQSERVAERLVRSKSRLRPDLLVSGVLSIKVRYDRKYGERLMREARLINRLKPPLNRVGHEDASWRRGKTLVFNRTMLPHELEDL